ncbi:MAG: CD225/dispanin family protein [Prevotella sp.]|jgi:cobalamin synthase|nr:CD225/dispanin family protein [Prevotella sp.]MDY6241402.1 CD225/dispanin family protein [Prevotella sp.]
MNNEMVNSRPDNYLVWAILSTVLCCLPFGIVSIVYAAKVNGLYAAKQYDEAETASKNAKKWAIIAAVSGVVIDIIYIIFALLGTAAVSA